MTNRDNVHILLFRKFIFYIKIMKKNEKKTEAVIELMSNLEITSEQRKFWVSDALKKATPVAKRWADHVIKNENLSFAEIEDMFMDINFIENDLYDGLKRNLVNHINRHGLGAKGLDFMRRFEEVEGFNVHHYEAVLKQIRKAFTQSSRKVENLQKQVDETRDYERRHHLSIELNILKREADDLEYLIAKINEFLKKMRDISDKGFELLLAGETPNLQTWKNQSVLNDRLFEENKQFLKQTLHHIDTLMETRCKLGVAEIRLLLYHKDGCRRQKLQKMVEDDIIAIFNQLESEDERKEIYPEICDFVSEIVPSVGYISPLMISFIFDRGFVSAISRDLLLKLQPVISRLNMTPLLVTQLQRYLKDTLLHLAEDLLTETDEYVLELTRAYMPKALSENVIETWHTLKS